jgi:hypothetical protein
VDKENVGYTQNGVLLSCKKRTTMSFAGKWIELEIIMLSEISQNQKEILCFFSHLQNLYFKKEDMKVEQGLLGKGRPAGGRDGNKRGWGINTIKVHSMQV